MHLNTHPGWSELGLRRAIGAVVFTAALVAWALGATMISFRSFIDGNLATCIAIAGLSLGSMASTQVVYRRFWPELTRKRPPGNAA